MSEIVARYEIPVEIFMPANHRDKVLQAINKAWGWAPKSIREQAPKGLENAHHNLFMTNVMTIKVDVDKDGNKTIRV